METFVRVFFKTFPKNCTYSCQEKAWTTVEAMEDFINQNWADIVINKTLEYENNVLL